MTTTSGKSERKLAAILFADIAGYTALMQTDESLASTLRRRFHQEMEAKVTEHHGQIIDFFGDGALCTFQNPLEAILCAKAIQADFQKEPIVPVRIGIHSGTIVVESEKIFGDSVNIASRIESIGIPGAILFSKKVRDEIKNQPEFHIQSLGSFDFKNVSEPMEVFALANEGLVVPKRATLRGKGKQSKAKKIKWPVLIAALAAIALFILAGTYFWKGDPAEPLVENENGIISSIAVFPFDVSGSPDIEYLGEGIVDLISTQLDQIPGLHSIDPNLLFGKLNEGVTISRQPQKAADLASKLWANKFILGSIVQIGDALEFSATKYDATGQELVRQSVRADQTEDIANTINQLIKQLVADELASAGYELGSLGAVTSNNLESLKLYLEGEQAYRKGDYRAARDLFTSATDLDSTFALAWMRIVAANSWIGYNNRDEKPMQKWGQYQHTMPKKWQLYYKATSLFGNGDLKAIPILKNLIHRYDNTAIFYYWLGEFYFHFNESYGRSATEAKPYFVQATEMDPGNQEAFWHLGNIAVMEHDIETLQQLDSLSNTDNPALSMLRLIVQDSVTDADIEHVLSLTPETLFFPMLYFASEQQPFHHELLSRFVQARPSEFGEELANVTIFNTTGREKEGFEASKKLAKRGNFAGYQLDQFHRCIPATLMAVEDFQPFSEHYEELFQETKDLDTPRDIYAAIKYAISLHKPSGEIAALKKKLLSLAITPKTSSMVKYYDFSIQAFEARMAGDNDQALVFIDSSYHHPFGGWELQGGVFWDKTILAANIYAEKGEFDKAISYFNHSYVIIGGSEVLMGYRNYKLSQWYEAIKDYENALLRCNILLESYQNCDAKYRPWVEEVQERRQRLIEYLN